MSFSRGRPVGDVDDRAARQDETIIEAAWCYYHEGLNQNEIAQRLGVSRASVVNYLAEA
ncbi:MAG: HTH domain-containing protein, partial [Gammaproteobacteria bacterium]|nr:HTH domain-containing protein [Gammaproteobacteria bacterium]